MIDGDKLKEDVVGRWPGIFNQLGIEIGDGRHKSCPICQEGKDRFRFDDKGGMGTWYCNNCGAGDGWSLIQKVLHVDFKEALEEVAGLIGSVEVSSVLKESVMTKEKMRSIYEGSVPVNDNDPVTRYLKGRGLTKIPTMLRYHPNCYESETKRPQKAMMAVFIGADNIACTMHRTYLTEDGEKMPIESPKKILPCLGKMNGGAVRLYPVGEVLGIAEGIETAIAASQDSGFPVWAALNSGMMECFEPPKEVKQVLIFADNDTNYAGQKSAYVLAHKLAMKKMPAIVYVPDIPGKDWADVVFDRIKN